MRGGMKTYRGSPAAARHYVEADRGRADDYYLAEGTGIAERYSASPVAGVRRLESLTGDGYEAWVAGVDPKTGQSKVSRCRPAGSRRGPLVSAGAWPGKLAQVVQGAAVCSPARLPRSSILRSTPWSPRFGWTARRASGLPAASRRTRQQASR